MRFSTTTGDRLPLLPLALAFAGLNVGAVILGATGPRPDSSADAVSDYLIANTGHVSLLSIVVLVTALPLTIWTTVVFARIRKLDPASPSPVIALAGGLLASMSLTVCGLVTWTSADTAELGDPVVSRTLSTLSFVLGGPGFVVMLGLLLAGVALSSLLLDLLPLPVAWAGLVLAAISVLSIASLLTSTLLPLLPVGRFGGAVWLIVATILLTNERQRLTINSGTAP